MNLTNIGWRKICPTTWSGRKRWLKQVCSCCNFYEEIIIFGWVFKMVALRDKSVLPHPFFWGRCFAIQQRQHVITMKSFVPKRFNISIFLCFPQEECFAAFLSVSKKVNDRDADMRSHIVLSMFKVHASLLYTHYRAVQWNLGKAKLNVKLVQIWIMVIMTLKLNNVKFTVIQPEWNKKDLSTVYFETTD